MDQMIAFHVIMYVFFKKKKNKPKERDFTIKKHPKPVQVVLDWTKSDFHVCMYVGL